MPHFEDYHRTIIGYHGTRKSVAMEIVQGIRSFEPSRNRSDWLGEGVYFWEHAPQQAWWWAERLRKKRGWDEDVAVLGSMIRLGNCLDLLDPENVDLLSELFEEFASEIRGSGRALPENYNHKKYLDCAFFRYAYEALDRAGSLVDTARAVYVPTGNKARLFKRSWIVRDAHVQVCVRSERNILGTWLVKPANDEEVGDADSNFDSDA